MSDRKEYAYQLRVEGKTYRAIGERLGVSLERARQLVCGGSPEWRAIRQETRALRDAGKTFKEIYKMMKGRKQRANQTCLQMKDDEAHPLDGG